MNTPRTMIDAAAFVKTVKLPKGADKNSVLKIRAAELLRLVEIAYLSGAKDALEPLQGIESDLPDALKSIFGAFSSRN